MEKKKYIKKKKKREKKKLESRPAEAINSWKHFFPFYLHFDMKPGRFISPELHKMPVFGK